MQKDHLIKFNSVLFLKKLYIKNRNFLNLLEVIYYILIAVIILVVKD